MAGAITKHRPHSNRTEADRMAAAERILVRRTKDRAGMLEIAQEEGISLPTCYRWLNNALARRESHAVEEFRKLENEALDTVERQNAEQLEVAEYLARQGAETGSTDLVLKASAMRAKAIDTRIRLAERRAKLNGLDAPVQVQATVTHLSDVDAELHSMVAEAERRLAEEEAASDAE